MKRRALLVVAVALLVVAATPATVVAQSEALVVGSQHSTASDFQTADTLENMTVEGSGDDAVVTLDSGYVADGFEGDDLSEWDESVDSAYSITSETVFEGTYAMEVSDSEETATRTVQEDSYDDLSLAYYPESFAGSSPRIRWQQGGDPLAHLYIGDDGNIHYTDGGAFSDTGITLPGDTWSVIRLTNIDYESETLDIEAVDGSGTTIGTATGIDFHSSVTGVDTIQFGGGGGGTAQGAVDDVQFSKGAGATASSAQYISGTHQVSNAEETAINITTVSNASVTLAAEYHDGSSWQEAVSNTVSSPGNYSLTLPPAGTEDWRVRADVDIQGQGYEFDLQDDSILFTNHAPEVDNSSASPSGGSGITSSEVDLEVDVSDREFGTAQGEEVTVQFRNADDDSLIGTDTLSSNRTASTTWDDTEGGSNSWYVDVQDSYGLETTSETFTFETPSSVSIYNETDHEQLIDNANAELVFYFGEDGEMIVERDASDGTIDMTGLPATESFVVVADADGYLPRRIFVESLFDTQEIYLLNESQDYASRTYELQDTTGRFPSDSSVLIIERNINGSWRTVQGDYFGAGGEWEAQLLRNERHRLLILNTETGDREPLGTVTPTGDGAQVIRVTEDGPLLVDGTTARVSIDPQVRSLPADENATVAVELLEENATVANWTVTAFVETPGGGTETIFETTETEPGTVDTDLNLTDYADSVLVVDVTWTTSSGIEGADMARFSIRQQFDNDYALLSVLAGIPNIFPSTTASTVTGIFALLGTFMVTVAVAASLPVSTEINGLVAVVALSVFGVIGWVTYDVVFAAGVGWLAFAGLRRGFR